MTLMAALVGVHDIGDHFLEQNNRMKCIRSTFKITSAIIQHIRTSAPEFQVRLSLSLSLRTVPRSQPA